MHLVIANNWPYKLHMHLQFAKGLEDIWGVSNATADLIVIGPLNEELHMSTSELIKCKLLQVIGSSYVSV